MCMWPIPMWTPYDHYYTHTHAHRHFHIHSHLLTCFSFLSVCKSLHNLQSTWKSKFFLLWSNYHAAWTLEWIFKSNTFLLTRTCPLWCPAEGYMWYTKPSLSASSTGPGWKANREDAELHALSIHYPVIVMLQQLLEQKATKTSCNVCKHYLLPVHHEWGLLMKEFQILQILLLWITKWSFTNFKERRFFDQDDTLELFSAFLTSYLCKWLLI